MSDGVEYATMRALEIIGIAAGVYLAGVALFLGPLFVWLALDRRASPRRRAFRAALEELGWAALVQPTLIVGFVFWPWWWRRSRRPAGDPEEPTVLLHGWGQNRADFWALALRLRRRGRGRLYAVNYWFFGPVERSAERLGRAVERIRRETGAERVHVVAHSLGGLVGRTYVEQQGGRDTVRTLVVVGSPLAGTHRAGGHWGASSKQMRPGSLFLKGLGAPRPPAGVRYHAVWSHSDQMVVPPDSGSLHGAGEELELPDLGHLTVLQHARTADATSHWLDAAERGGRS